MSNRRERNCLRNFLFDTKQLFSTLYRMGIAELLNSQRNQILALAAKYGAFNIRVFGSVARGEADSKSDVDFLVDLEEGRSLLDLGGFLMDLQKLLQRNVDVVTTVGLRPRIKEQVLKEAIPL